MNEIKSWLTGIAIAFALIFGGKETLLRTRVPSPAPSTIKASPVDAGRP